MLQELHGQIKFWFVSVNFITELCRISCLVQGCIHNRNSAFGPSFYPFPTPPTFPPVPAYLSFTSPPTCRLLFRLLALQFPAYHATPLICPPFPRLLPLHLNPAYLPSTKQSSLPINPPFSPPLSRLLLLT